MYFSSNRLRYVLNYASELPVDFTGSIAPTTGWRMGTRQISLQTQVEASTQLFSKLILFVSTQSDSSY